MSSRDPIAAEIRRRTYWACFLHDRLLSDGRDRPVTMRTPLHHSIRLPGSETDFLGGRLNRAAKFESNPAPWTIPAPSPLQMTIKPAAEVDINGLILRASDLWSRIAGYVGAGGRASDRRAVSFVRPNRFPIRDTDRVRCSPGWWNRRSPNSTWI